MLLVAVYASNELQLAVVQFRAPLAKVKLLEFHLLVDMHSILYCCLHRLDLSQYYMICLCQGCRNSFCSRLLDWIKEKGFSEVVLLTSSHAHERRDSQIRG